MFRGSRALPHRDMAALDRIYAHDMAFVARGKVITKAQYVGALRPRDMFRGRLFRSLVPSGDVIPKAIKMIEVPAPTPLTLEMRARLARKRSKTNDATNSITFPVNDRFGKECSGARIRPEPIGRKN